MTVKVVLVERGGDLSDVTVKNPSYDTLYKKAGFKKPDGFVCQVSWGVKLSGEQYCIKLFARSTGKANTENKYDFPPPVDTDLYFGKCILIRAASEADETVEDLTVDVWERIYEKLFGGFEDLAATAKEDEDEVDELLEYPEDMKTKHGYLKDGFVVDDDDEQEEEEDSELEVEEYEPSDSE